jgi:uncharacterized protein
MTDPTFGISIRRVDEEARPVLGADLSTIGLVGPAPGADPDAFPLNTPVLTRTNDGLLVRKLGTQGYLRDALEGIADQLGELQRAARTIVVRTQAGEGDDPTERLNQTIAGIVGSSTEGTGIHALTRAPSLLGFTPRLIIVPGYTGQTALSDTVGRIAQTYRGRGYVQGETYELEFAGGDPTTPAAAHAIGQDDGSLGYAVIDEHGAGYQSAPTVTAPPPPEPEDEDEPEGRPATFLAYMGLGANPVCAALPFVLEQLLGHAVVESSGINLQNDFDWRETMQSGRLIAISGGVQVFDSITGAVIARPLAPRVVGIAVRRDHEQGAPFHSWANQPVQGIIAPGRDIDFSILDGENEGQELLNANVGVLVRGEIGSDFAIASGGFVFIGTDNVGEDELWRFYNVTRGRDYIHLGLIRALRFFLGRFNITGQTVQAILNTMGFFLRDLQAQQNILGYRVTFTGGKNSAEQIRLGKLSIGFKAEEPPVLRHIITESARYREAIDATIAQLERMLGIAA